MGRRVLEFGVHGLSFVIFVGVGLAMLFFERLYHRCIISWNFSHRSYWSDTYCIGDTSLAPRETSQRPMLSAQCPVTSLSLPPLMFATHAEKLVHRWDVFVLYVWLMQKLGKNLLAFGQEVHLRQGMAWDRMGWDGESLTSGCVTFFVFGVGVPLCVASSAFTIKAFSCHFSHRSFCSDTYCIGDASLAPHVKSQCPMLFCPVSNHETEPTASNVCSTWRKYVHRRDIFGIHER